MLSDLEIALLVNRDLKWALTIGAPKIHEARKLGSAIRLKSIIWETLQSEQLANCDLSQAPR